MKVGLEITRRKRRVVAPLNLGRNVPTGALNGSVSTQKITATIEKARSKKFVVENGYYYYYQGYCPAKCQMSTVTDYLIYLQLHRLREPPYCSISRSDYSEYHCGYSRWTTYI